MDRITRENLLWAWGGDPAIVLAVILVASLYAVGADRLWRRRRQWHGVSPRHLGCFAGGLAMVLAALASPLEPLSRHLLSAHMVQHLTLVLGAAPLIAAGRPQMVLAMGLPDSAQHGLRRLRSRLHRVPAPTRVPKTLIAVTGLHVVSLWAWHVPLLYGSALRSDGLHAVEHLWFFGTALAFWIMLLRPDRRSRMAHGAGVLCVAAILIGGGILGALITFAGAPLYPDYAGTAAWGLSGLEDQQLAGVIMWVPSAIFYGIVAAITFTRWMRLIEDWTRTREVRSP